MRVDLKSWEESITRLQALTISSMMCSGTRSLQEDCARAVEVCGKVSHLMALVRWLESGRYLPCGVCLIPNRLPERSLATPLSRAGSGCRLPEGVSVIRAGNRGASLDV